MNKTLLIAGAAVAMTALGTLAQAATPTPPGLAATAGPVEANSQAMEAADQIGTGKSSIRQHIQD